MSNFPYTYRVMMTSSVCSAKRAVAFSDDRHLDWYQASREACQHFTSQTCHKCNKNHRDETYVATDIERGEPNHNGEYRYYDVFPARASEDNNQYEMSL